MKTKNIVITLGAFIAVSTGLFIAKKVRKNKMEKVKETETTENKRTYGLSNENKELALGLASRVVTYKEELVKFKEELKADGLEKKTEKALREKIRYRERKAQELEKAIEKLFTDTGIEIANNVIDLLEDAKKLIPEVKDVIKGVETK